MIDKVKLFNYMRFHNTKGMTFQQIVEASQNDDSTEQANKVIPVKGFGDKLAALTKSFGITPCSSCEERRKLLNDGKYIEAVKHLIQNGMKTGG